MLGMTASLQASDPRDKIFALVGLVDGAPPAIVDYDLDLPNILIQLATLLSVKVPVFTLLSFVHRESTIPGLPSWVYDWTERTGFYPAEAAFNLIEGSLFCSLPEAWLIQGEVSDSAVSLVMTVTSHGNFR